MSNIRELIKEAINDNVYAVAFDAIGGVDEASKAVELIHLREMLWLLNEHDKATENSGGELWYAEDSSMFMRNKRKELEQKIKELEK